jgi:hypothetical protein
MPFSSFCTLSNTLKHSRQTKLQLGNSASSDVASRPIMVYIKQWQDYTTACQELCLASPNQVRTATLPFLPLAHLDGRTTSAAWGTHYR